MLTLKLAIRFQVSHHWTGACEHTSSCRDGNVWFFCGNVFCLQGNVWPFHNYMLYNWGSISSNSLQLDPFHVDLDIDELVVKPMEK